MSFALLDMTLMNQGQEVTAASRDANPRLKCNSILGLVIDIVYVA